MHRQNTLQHLKGVCKNYILLYCTVVQESAQTRNTFSKNGGGGEVADTRCRRWQYLNLPCIISCTHVNVMHTTPINSKPPRHSRGMAPIRPQCVYIQKPTKLLRRASVLRLSLSIQALSVCTQRYLPSN